MHWVDAVSEQLLERGNSHKVASGTSISGQIHFGNAGDVMIAEGIIRALDEKGGSGDLLWIMDDMDPLRSVPEQLPQSFSKYLGYPDFNIPCPEDHCTSFIEHFTTPFIEALDEVGVYPEIISSAELYTSGQMEPYVIKALENTERIREIIQRISGSEKSDVWLPFDPICASCGKITPTTAMEWDPDDKVVRYRCDEGVAGKKKILGCGYEGEAKLTEGKLTWRVDWAARWALLGVTCEPFGKEHAAAGGSYATSSVICKEIFETEPPFPVPYEFILVGGQKMSKSLGNVISLSDVTSSGTAELSRFFFYRSKVTSQKDLQLSKTLVPLIENYEWVERVYHGQDDNFPAKEEEELRRSYEFSQVESVPETYFQVPFTHLLSIVQIAPDWDSVLKALARTGTPEVPEEHVDRLKRKIAAARYFLENHAPDQMIFSLLDEAPELEAEDRKVIEAYLNAISGVDWTADELHNAVYTAAEQLDVKGGAVFRALYRAFLGKDRGPRLGFFLASLDRDFVLERLGS